MKGNLDLSFARPQCAVQQHDSTQNRLGRLVDWFVGFDENGGGLLDGCRNLKTLIQTLHLDFELVTADPVGRYLELDVAAAISIRAPFEQEERFTLVG